VSLSGNQRGTAGGQPLPAPQVCCSSAMILQCLLPAWHGRFPVLVLQSQLLPRPASRSFCGQSLGSSSGKLCCCASR